MKRPEAPSRRYLDAGSIRTHEGDVDAAPAEEAVEITLYPRNTELVRRLSSWMCSCNSLKHSEADTAQLFPRRTLD